MYRKKGAENLETVVIRLRAQAGIKEGSIKDEEAVREASGRGLRGARVFSSRRLFSRWLTYRPARGCTSGEKGASRCCHSRDADGTRHCRRHSDTPHSSHRFSAQSSDGGGYMGQIAGACARLAEAAAEEELARVKFDMSRREIGELEKRWKAVEREASQGERDVKKMQAEAESPRKNADGTGWSPEKR